MRDPQYQCQCHISTTGEWETVLWLRFGSSDMTIELDPDAQPPQARKLLSYFWQGTKFLYNSITVKSHFVTKECTRKL